MFTEEELEGCPSPQFEEWLQANEGRIRSIATVFDSHSHWQGSKSPYYEDSSKLEELLPLLMDAYSAKRCPYA